MGNKHQINPFPAPTTIRTQLSDARVPERVVRSRLDSSEKAERAVTAMF